MEGDNPVYDIGWNIKKEFITIMNLSYNEEIIIKSRVAWECIPKDGGKFHRKLNNIAKDR